MDENSRKMLDPERGGVYNEGGIMSTDLFKR